MCMVLPEVIEKVVNRSGEVKVPQDSVVHELRHIAEATGEQNENLAMAIAVYMLGFNTYTGFSKLIKSEEDNYLKRIYSYAKEVREF